MLVRIGKHLGVRDCEDPDVRILEQATQPEQLARQIDRSATIASAPATRRRKSRPPRP